MLDLSRLESERVVAASLGVRLDVLQAWQLDSWKAGALAPLDRQRRGSKPRRVWSVTDSSFAIALKNLALAAQAAYLPPSHVHGYVAGQSILKNAKAHLGQQKVLVADISSFFASISATQISDAWLRLGVGSQEGANALAAVCTFRGVLPEGLHTSPVLSNAVCWDLDEDLAMLSRQYGGQLSRYADDITMSGQDVPTEREISDLLARRGFVLKPRSYRVMLKGQTQLVCGVSVADPTAARAPKHAKRRLRSEAYKIEKFGLQDVATARGLAGERLYREIWGLYGWIRSIEPAFRSKALARLRLIYGNP